MNTHRLIIALVLMIISTHESLAMNSSFDWAALNQGKVVVEEIQTDSGMRGVQATFLVKASREKIWNTLLDYDNFQKFFQGIDRMKVLEQDQNGARVEFWADAILWKLHYILYRNYEKPGYRLTWKQESGDLKDIEGSWWILDTDDPEKKLLVYESYVDIGYSLITWAIRKGAKREARKMGKTLRNWLENEH